jgi:uncharacterized membrane protein YqjE
MGNNAPPPAGILKTLRKLGRTGVALLQNRIELFSVELEEQKARLVKILVLAGVAIFVGNAALLAVSAAIVVLAGPEARVYVLIALSALYILVALWAFLALREELWDSPPPFEDSVSELKKDGDWLNPPNHTPDH